MNGVQRSQELKRLMRAYGNGLVRLCYTCLRDEALAHWGVYTEFGTDPL